MKNVYALGRILSLVDALQVEIMKQQSNLDTEDSDITRDLYPHLRKTQERLNESLNSNK